MKPDAVENLPEIGWAFLSDLVPGKDTIYIQKIDHGFMQEYFCTFEGVNRGIVTGRVLGVCVNPDLYRSVIGTVLTARPSSCFLWGNGEGRYPRCHWFKRGGHKVWRTD